MIDQHHKENIVIKMFSRENNKNFLAWRSTDNYWTAIFAPDKWFGAFLYQKTGVFSNFCLLNHAFLPKKKCLGPLRQAKRIDSLFILLFLNHCYFQLFHAFMPYQGHFLNLHFSQVRSVISSDIVRARLLAQVFSYHFHCFHYKIWMKSLPWEVFKINLSDKNKEIGFLNAI